MDESTAPNPTGSPVPVHPVPWELTANCFFFQQRKSCLCAAIPVELVVGSGPRPLHSFDKTWLCFDIVSYFQPTHPWEFLADGSIMANDVDLAITPPFIDQSLSGPSVE